MTAEEARALAEEPRKKREAAEDEYRKEEIRKELVRAESEIEKACKAGYSECSYNAGYASAIVDVELVLRKKGFRTRHWCGTLTIAW